ncbi:MAG: GlsB/YeaQ/YmgE family stress response membrane protein [Sandaracinaceae bacterium]|nr:GlsB/YeaQ/YmgE family stress response membrane protein [Sandaracinaceae bacterium]
MSWILFILFGLVIGLLARALVPGRQNIGILWTIGLGIAGSLLGGFVARLITGASMTDGLHTAGFVQELDRRHRPLARVHRVHPAARRRAGASRRALTALGSPGPTRTEPAARAARRGLGRPWAAWGRRWPTTRSGRTRRWWLRWRRSA